MAGVQDLRLQLPRRDAPYHFIALIGASVVVLSAAGEPPVRAGYALAGFLLWLLGAARLLSLSHMGAYAAAAANLARSAVPCHYLLVLIGASVVVLSVAGEPPVHAGYALAGFLLWLLGAARLLPFGKTGALAAAAAHLARHGAAYYHHLLMLIGASAVVFSIAGEPPVGEVLALTGFLLWILGVANLLFGQNLHALLPGALAAAATAANVAMEKLKHFVFRRGYPAPA
ncbi:hypothetical protein ACP70R_039506 [Stipagrostis hirtigluma subsp. patula]